MKRPETPVFFFVTCLLALLMSCVFQNQSSTSTPAYTYQWMVEFSDNFTGYSSSWRTLSIENFSGQPLLPWSWSDTSGGKLTLEDSGAIVTGRVQGTTFIKGVPASTPVRLSMDIRFSSLDSNSAGVMLVDSAAMRRYVLGLGRDGSGSPSPGVLSLFCESMDNARKILYEAHQTVVGLTANTGCQLFLTVDSSSMEGRLFQEGTLIADLAVDSGNFIGSNSDTRLYTVIDFEGTASLPVHAYTVTVESILPYYDVYSWQWSDPSAIIIDAHSSINPGTAVGHASGIPLVSAVRYGWTTDSPLRVSMDINLASTATGAGAVTVLDSASNRLYWLIIGNTGIGNAAAGKLSVIITQADNFQTIISQAQNTVQDLNANTVYQLVLTLGVSKVIGEVRQTGSTLVQTEIQSSAVTAGNQVTFFPGVDLAGSASSPVYAGNFQVESFQQVSTGSGGSCPFIYSFDGVRDIIDAEPYGGSICKGLKRTEWSVLGHLKETCGAYKVLMTNELDETQFTDELKLLVIDHPCSLIVAPDVSGGIHTLSRPHGPLSAVDRAGKDIRALCSAKDGNQWTGSMKQFDPDAQLDPRDTLTFRFAKPGNAASAKLLINTGTTAWGAAMGRRFLAMYGSGLGLWYDEVDKGGTAHERIMNWYHDEELYMLKLQVATRDGWKTRATIIGAGPVIAPDRVYVIDVHDVPGETLTVRMAPPAGFWKIDWIATDYAKDAPITTHRISPLQALSPDGNDVRQALDKIDDSCHIAEKGDSVRMVFPAPAQAKGTGRTVVLEANGYYTMHLKATGLPEFALLADLNKPGFSARFALKQYLKQEQAHAR